MENETKAPVEAPGEPNLPRVHFHLVLALILVPFIAAGVGWTLAIIDVLKGYASRAQLNWTRILVLLVIVDSAVAAGWFWMISNKDEFQKMTEAHSPPKSRVGVIFDPEDRAGAALIARTMTDLPAEKAGLLAGDLIVKIDATAVASQGDALDAMARGEPGVARKIRIRRGGEEREIEVVPVAPPRVGLFQILKEEKRSGLPDLRPLLPALGFAFLAWAVGRRRFGDRGTVWLGVLLCLAGAELIALGAGWAVDRIIGGVTVGGVLIVTCLNGAAILGLGLALRRFLPPMPATPAVAPAARTYFRGVFYLLAGAFRIGYLLLLIDLFWLSAKGGSNPIQQLVEATDLGGVGAGLLLVATVVLAPLGEELLFRGILLPRLPSKQGPLWAVGVSSVFFALLHPHYGLYLPLILLYGVVLGWARLQTRGLKIPILLHLSINGLATGMMLLR